ncbi:chronophin [Drosophila tropicalis]|uniref:chronophin n=1 Tax=Drosophila tropicalis TaxID=46794 RepID=UPI0035ABEFC0
MFKQTCTHLAKLPKADVIQWLNSFESIITDADGVLWHFDKAIDGSVDTFNLMRAKGKQTFVVTNNASQLTEKIHKKATNFGFELKEDQVLTASLAVANFLKAKKFKKKVYVLGEEGIVQELAKAGICGTSKTPERNPKEPVVEYARNMSIDPDVGAVVVAKDDEFTIAKIMTACSYLMNPRVVFLGTCLDAAYPVGNGVIVGAAAMVSAVSAICKRKPLILGKPNPTMVAELQNKGVIKPATTLMVGDTLQTDILLAHNCGFQSLFVGSGVNSLEDVNELQESGDEKKMVLVPDTYVPSLAHLQEYLCECCENSAKSK